MKQEMSRKERRRRQHREEILSVALALFSEKGFHNVTIREIAGRAEFSTGTLYNLFESKEALFSELLREPAQKIHGDFLHTLAAEGGEVAKITGFFRCHNRICMEYKEGFKLYYTGLKNADSALSCELVEEIEALREDIRTHIKSVFGSGIQKGIFRPLDPEAMTMTLRALLEELLSMLMGGCDEGKLMAVAEQMEDIFMAGIMTRNP